MRTRLTVVGSSNARSVTRIWLSASSRAKASHSHFIASSTATPCGGERGKHSNSEGQQRQGRAASGSGSGSPPAAAASATAGPADRLCSIPQCAPRLPRRRTEGSGELGPLCTTGQAYQQQRRQRDQHEAGRCQVQVQQGRGALVQCSPLAPGRRELSGPCAMQPKQPSSARDTVIAAIKLSSTLCARMGLPVVRLPSCLCPPGHFRTARQIADACQAHQSA